MNKSSLLLMTLALTTWSWIRRPVGNLVDRIRERLGLSEDDALRAMAWLRTELHNLSVASPGSKEMALTSNAKDSASEAAVRKALCIALDAHPVVTMWVSDAVFEGAPQTVESFPLSPALDHLACRLLAAPAATRDAQLSRARLARFERRLQFGTLLNTQMEAARANIQQVAPKSTGRAQYRGAVMPSHSGRVSAMVVRPPRHPETAGVSRRGR